MTNAILPNLEPIKKALPPGYRIETGGAIEESEKGNGSFFAMFPIMIAATLILLMLQLQSFSRLRLFSRPLAVQSGWRNRLLKEVCGVIGRS